MATVLKEKIKKKKKIKQTLTEAGDSLVQNDVLDLSQSNFTTPTTLISHDCVTATPFPKTSKILSDTEHNDSFYVPCEKESNDLGLGKETTEIENTGENLNLEINEQNENKSNTVTAPSAPPSTKSSENQISFPTQKQIQYPDLTKFQINSKETINQINQSQSKMSNTKVSIQSVNPMTRNQLSQLYDCKMLDLVKQFELEFLATVLNQNFDSDPLYIYLQQYALARSKIKINIIDLDDLVNKFETIKNDIWKTVIETAQGSSRCSDNIRVYATANYEVLSVDEHKFQNLISTLNKTYELICFSLNNNKMNAKKARLKIEQIVREILSYACFSNMSPKMLSHKETDSLILQGLNHLRRALSILFSCVRKPAPDKIFTKDVTDWIRTLVAAYLKIATFQDNWFLLFHLLRCPSGVSIWATDFVQISEPSLLYKGNLMDSPEINQCLSILQILLQPIKKRNEFLRALSKSHSEISDPVRDDVWILVDSDGEEGNNGLGECTGLKENDLILFLNQVPLEMIFRCIINAKKTKNDYDFECDHITEQQFLRLIAFNTKLVELFGDGLITYNAERYKQFAKRLGRLIRHTIHYMFDIHEVFLRNKLSKDPYMCEQITVEMNAFIIKSCSYIYKTPNLATWQYFSSLPFAQMESETLWQLFFYLNVGFPEEYPVANEDFKKSFLDSNFWQSFNIAIADLTSEDLYYLIQSFFEMANERDRLKDWDFIEIVCLHIFLIGFVNELTRETCYKTSRDMLTNLTLTYPELIASLLQKIKIHFNESTNLAYLIKSIPLENWKTDIQSFEILSVWLLNFNYDCKENALARLIISHLNWSFDTDKRLFLPHNIHVRMACLVCEALNKHNPEVIGSSTSISESMKQFSNLIESHSNKDQFTTWCWNMIYILRLHLMDQNSDAIQKTLQNPSYHLCFVPEIENFDIIYQGVTENRPLAIYISILISLWGHSVPLICQKGIAKMKLLLVDYRYTCVIRCIQLITPLFLESPDTLATYESFHEILKILFNADRTYFKLAKDFMLANSHGPVFTHFLNMLQSQIIHYYETGLTTPSLFIHLWLQILINHLNWQNTNVVYLIDAILKIAYQFSDSWNNCKELFREYYKNCQQWKNERSSTLKILLGSSNQNKNFPTISTDCGWLSLLLLELEHETQEEQNLLWSEFLANSLQSNEKNLDNILKKCCSAVGCNQFSVSSLVLFKYANLISNADVNHPLLPIFCQKFFILYLARINLTLDEERFHNVFSVSDKLYEYNLTLMKKLKTKFKQANENYCKLAQNNADNEVLSYFYNQCSRIMTTFSLWLEETDLQKIRKNQRIDLPPQYNTEKLGDILNGNQQHWTEFIYLRKIRDQQKHSSSEWLKYCFRLEEIKPRRSGEILAPKRIINAVERIKNHLKSYDKPLGPPKFEKLPLLFASLNYNSIDSSTLDELRKELKYVDKYISDSTIKFKEILSLNNTFKDQIQLLYKNVPYLKSVTQECSSLTRFNKSCTGSALISLKLSRPQKMESVQRKLDENRDKYNYLKDEIVCYNMDAVAYSIQNMEHIVRCLLMAQVEIEEKQKDNIQITRVAIDFLYDMLKSINKRSKSIETCYETYSTIIHELGIFVQNNQETEGLRILDMSLKRPDLIQLLSELLIPSKARSTIFLMMYKFLIDAYCLNKYDTKILFVLFSKFDIQNWLEKHNNEKSDIKNLLELIFRGLQNWNNSESSQIQDLFKRQLMHVYNFRFPKFYMEILQSCLVGISEQKLCTVVLLDLMNTLLKNVSCDTLTLESSKSVIEEVAVNFANQQNILDFSTINATFTLFSQHFQNERLHNGFHGIYPKFKNQTTSLSIWFTVLSRTLVTSAVSTYPGVLGDQICDSVFAPIISLYSPWIVIYKQKDFQQSTVDWMKQFSSNAKDLLPWTESYLDEAELMIESFIGSLQYVISNLPVSYSTLAHTYSWYQHHFVASDPSKLIVQKPIHKALMKLPWEKFLPNPIHIDCFYRVLSESSPECHSFLAHIFTRIPWSTWIHEQFYSWDSRTQMHAISLMFSIFIEISFEPTINQSKQANILDECLDFPWHLVDLKNIEATFNWLMLSVNIIELLGLKPEIQSAVNKTILKLLKLACGMSKVVDVNSAKYQIHEKRILFVRNIVRMLHTCSKNFEEISPKFTEMLKLHQQILVTTLDSIEEILSNEMSPEERDIQGQNLVLEIIGSLQHKSHIFSKYFIDAIILWQSRCHRDSIVLTLMLNSFGLCKSINLHMYPLLEATIYNSFRFCNTDIYSWKTVLKRLNGAIECLDYELLLKGPYFLVLHTYIICKIQKLNTPGEKITFLQDISQLLENLKTNETNESRLILIWGAVITCACKMLLLTENIRKTLLMIARQLLVIAKQSDGWGGTLLGAIGLRRDTNFQRRKSLFRSLSCLIFSLFPDQSASEIKESQEFISTMNELINESMNKSCSNHKEITEAIEIIMEFKNADPASVANCVFILTKIFYKDNFFKSAQEVWII